MKKNIFLIGIPMFFLVLFNYFSGFEINSFGIKCYLNSYFTISFKIIISVYLLYRLSKHDFCLPTFFLCLALIFNIIADLIYVYLYFIPIEKRYSFLEAISTTLYGLTAVYFLLFLCFSYLKKWKELFIIISLGLICFCSGWGLSEYSFKEFYSFAHISSVKFFLLGLHFVHAVIVGAVIVFSLREQNFKRLLFLQCLMLPCIAEYGLSVRIISNVESIFFEHLWEFGFILISVLILTDLSLIRRKTDNVLQFLNIRSIIVIISLTSSISILLFLKMKGIIQIQDNEKVCYTMFSVYSAWCFSNFIGLYISSHITHKTNTDGSNEMVPTNIAEIDNISEEYNRVQKQYKDEMKYGVIGRAAVCIVETVKGSVYSSLKILNKRNNPEEIKLIRGISTIYSYINMIDGMVKIPVEHVKHLRVQLKAYINMGKRSN